MNIRISRSTALRAASLLGLGWIEAEATSDEHEEFIQQNAMVYKAAVASMSGLSLRDTWIDELNSVCVGLDTLPGIGQE